MSKRVQTTRRLEVWLKETSIALFVLNSQRRLVFFNAGCEQTTGWPSTEVLGKICNYSTESDSALPSAVLSSLAPPADVWSGKPITITISLARRDLEPLNCFVQYLPLNNSEQKVQAVLGILCNVGDTLPQTQPISISLHAKIAALRHSLSKQFGENSLIGQSPAFRRAMDQMKLAQQSSVPVLFVGETGSGRQQIARTIHNASDRKQSAFVPIDCKRLPSDYLSATLRRLSGEIDETSLRPGTLYLTNVEFLSRELQVRIVELIEANDANLPRVMAATKNSLEPFVQSDVITTELFFALTPLTINVPSLRSRMDDLELLAQFFLEELNRGDERQITGFQDDVWQQFRRYNWPGNLSELRTVVSEARSQCTGSIIQSDELPSGFRLGVDRQLVGPLAKKRAVPLDPLLLQVEREQIELALAEARQNKARAAELLGITRPRLYRRMEILGIADREVDENH